MTLKVQILTLLFSFIFGILFSFLLNINYKLTIKVRLRYRIITTFLFVIDSMLLYFLILKKINYGIIHFYGLLAIILGFIIENILKFKIIAKQDKK